jgi:hypothetical protein
LRNSTRTCRTELSAADVSKFSAIARAGVYRSRAGRRSIARREEILMAAEPPKPLQKPVRTLSDGVANPKQGGGSRGGPSKPKGD